MAMFRVRNLLIQVLPPMACEADSACIPHISGDPGACAEASAAACVESTESPDIWQCGCSLHFDTGCNIWRYSLVCRSPAITLDCVPGGVTLVNKEGELAAIADPDPCPDPNSGCQVLVSLPMCPVVTDTGCGIIVNSGVAVEMPVRVCFRSDEPRLNPNSLADLGVLRRQLAAGLEIVERRERALSAELTPQTTQQVEQAEAILNSALEGLKMRKEHIQSRAPAAAKRAKKSRARKK
jgi:hypothetical protein